MPKKYKLLFHIGMLKTATTSLQHNVLYPLHQAGKINYLGKVGQRKFRKIIFYPSKMIIKAINKGLTQQAIKSLKINFEKQLSINKLNVLSDENFSELLQYYPAQVADIFGNCDVHILCSLRSPVDFVYSIFVEFYYWRLHSQNHKNTFVKFSQHLLDNSHSKEYLFFFYEDYLSLIDQYFSHKTILLFEDLSQDEDYYFATLADLLGVDKNEIKDKFLVEKLNLKKTNSAGKMSNSVPVLPFLKLYKLMGETRFFKYCMAHKKTALKYPWMLLSYARKMLVNIVFWKAKAVTHPYPDKNLDSKLFALLKIKDKDTFAKQHNLDANKLSKYRY